MSKVRLMASRQKLDPDRLSPQDEVLKGLEEDIIFGRLAPGSRLVEDALMARFGVTRHFIREALVKLEHRGVVTREPNVGARVCSYSAEEVEQIYEVREMLTRQAALKIRLPAEETLIKRLTALQEHYKAYAERGNLRGIHETNDAFHLALFSACGNAYLVRSIQDYMGLTLPMRAKNLADPEGLETSIRQHQVMIQLLRERDNWALAQLCVEHMQFSKFDYLDRIVARRGTDSSRRAADGSVLRHAGKTGKH